MAKVEPLSASTKSLNEMEKPVDGVEKNNEKSEVSDFVLEDMCIKDYNNSTESLRADTEVKKSEKQLSVKDDDKINTPVKNADDDKINTHVKNTDDHQINTHVKNADDDQINTHVKNADDDQISTHVKNADISDGICTDKSKDEKLSVPEIDYTVSSFWLEGNYKKVVRRIEHLTIWQR